MVTPVQIEGEDLWQRISSAEALQAAWGKVQANGGSAGGDGISQKEFASDLFGNITQIRAELLSGSYRASQFRRVAIPKKKPGYRVLTIPSIRVYTIGAVGERHCKIAGDGPPIEPESGYWLF